MKKIEAIIKPFKMDDVREALGEIGIKVANDLIWNIPVSNELYANQAAKEVLSLNPRPTHIICMSDVVALELLQVAYELGIVCCLMGGWRRQENCLKELLH